MEKVNPNLQKLQNLKAKLKEAKQQNKESKIQKLKEKIQNQKQIIKEEEEQEQQIEEDQDQIAVYRQKLQQAQESGKTKKVQKYKQIIQELKQQNNEQEEEQNPEDLEKTSKKVKKASQDINLVENSNQNNEIEQEQQEEDLENQELLTMEDIQNDIVESIQQKIVKAKEQNKTKKILKQQNKANQAILSQLNLRQQKLDHYKSLSEKKQAKKQSKIDALNQEIQELKKSQKIFQNQALNDEQNFIQKFVQTDADSFRLNPDKVQHQITIVLFYQYIEPEWTHPRFKEALNFAQTTGDRLQLGGRLRVAYEGFNGTISGSYHNVREFCEELRKWEPKYFTKTLFKFIDGLPQGTHFPNLKVFEVKELVNYGLDGNQPNIQEWGGTHLPPKEYHKKMEEGNSVIIDVRNTYESIIGRFQPPDDKKCEFIDPCWRRSTELPEWLRKQEVLSKLKDKNVLMYCTGGVRCERASAYLRKELGDHVQNVYQLEGGIEQYMKEFPEGGYWVGKNYTFDKRFAFGAYGKDYRKDDVLSYCSGCKKPWDRYRGKKRCSACLVPIIVCKECQDSKLDKKKNLRCTLCEEQNVAPKIKRVPISVQMNQGQQNNNYDNYDDDEAEEEVQEAQEVQEPKQNSRKNSVSSRKNSVASRKNSIQQPNLAPNPQGKTRVFVGNLPFSADEQTIRKFFQPAKLQQVVLLTDKTTGKFYGNAFVEGYSSNDASICVGMNGQTMNRRNLRIEFPRNSR